MVKVLYRKDGKSKLNCRFLDIPQEDEEKLFEILNKQNFDEEIEVNIVKKGTIIKEFKKDQRIRDDLKYGILKEWAEGKRITKKELKPPFKNLKICYSSFGTNFDKTIVNIFHELNHFENVFDLSEEEPEDSCESSLLEYNIKIGINEYTANKKVVIQLIDIKELKEIIISEGNNYFRSIFTYILKPINQLSKKEKISKFFDWGFIKFFRYLGYWKGFQETGDISEIEEGWKDFISKYYYDFIEPEIFISLKSIISNFNCDFNEIFGVFKDFFEI
jgi:hypothetical protein